jgi:hypothetical protein
MIFRIAFSLLAGAALFAANTGSRPVTFAKDVLPVLQKNCQECHRPGEAAPMSFLSYKDARPWAKAIKASVLKGSMPPWFADPNHGHFRNARLLSAADRETLVNWADAGAPEGDPRDAPRPVAFIEGWTIGQPDQVFSMPKPFPIPAQGTVEYQYIIIPTGFTEDRWVERAEVRPGNRAINHHVIAFVRPPGSKWLAGFPKNEVFVPVQRGRRAQGTSEDGANMFGVELLVGYAPGLQATEAPEGLAKLVPAGSDIVFQLHYTTNGKETSDQSKIGLVYAKQPPKYRQLTVNATNTSFVIPAGAAAHEVKSSLTLYTGTQLVWMMPHMHVRGKDFVYTAVYPTGEREVLLNVPRYDFNWQLGYVLKDLKVLPAGTRIECVAHFDNSANNAANPDPKSEVRWGDQTWQEMMIGWFDLAVDPKLDILDLYRPKPVAKPKAD